MAPSPILVGAKPFVFEEAFSEDVIIAIDAHGIGSIALMDPGDPGLESHAGHWPF